MFLGNEIFVFAFGVLFCFVFLFSFFFFLLFCFVCIYSMKFQALEELQLTFLFSLCHTRHFHKGASA